MSLARARALLLTVLLVALGAPLLAFAPPAAADGSARTVEATWHPWIPNFGVKDDPDFGPVLVGAYDESRTPDVTVEQTSNLADQVVKVSWRNFTPSSNNPTYSDPGQPPPPQPTFGDGVLYGVDVLQCRGANPTQNPVPPAGPVLERQCYRQPVFPNPQGGEGPAGPNNSIGAVTQADGTGSVQFHVENAVSNDALRCSPAQPCSIVVVPNQGGLQQPDTPASCDDHSRDVIGPPDYEDVDNARPSRAYGDCSWSKRVVVPLSFAPIPGTCPQQASSFTAVGSPPLQRGLNQLLSAWCRGADRVNFDYNATSNEYLARTRFLYDTGGALTSSTDIALVSQPADAVDAAARRFVYAPIANDAVAIPYAIDDPQTGQPIDDLRLNARLVAKLLTQSYNPVPWDCAAPGRDGRPNQPNCARAVRGNPTTIFDDPEFQRLNFRGTHATRESFPNFQATSQTRYGSFFPTVSAGDSDLTWALTRWIASDPEARSFLQGRPDPFGMRINGNYLPTRQQQAAGQTLYPTSQFQALDPGYSAPNVARPDLAQDPRSTQGFQGSWNPVSGLPAVTTNLLTNRSTATGADGDCATGQSQDCSAAKANSTYVFKKLPAESFGSRGLTGVTDNSEAEAYRLPTAQLVTRTGTAVAPTTDSMARALASMKTHRDRVTQYQDYGSIPGDAYPVMLPVYAMVPTCGLTAAKARGIATMLRKVTESQTYGLNPGQLAPGLLALSSAQLAKTRAAQDAVGTQSCVTAPTGNGPAPGPGPVGNAPGPGGAVQNPGAGSGTGGGSGGTDPSPRGSVRASTSPKPNPAPSGGAGPSTRNVGYPLKDPGGMPLLLPVLLILGGALLMGSPLLWWFSGTAAGQGVLARLGVRR